MFSVKQEIQSNIAFHGVRFALFGFDPPKQIEIRSKLVGGGAVDVGQYGPNCTHVIVDKLVYDDPVCVAARQDGKILVTSLWVRHSLDVGMPVEASPVMYKPVKDLDGIPAAKNFIMCLTGYQRQDREDIMTMVSMMGAQFSKPLMANRVTHLICYKFEGEKYELANRIKKIKLVNHRWLEDCLKAWEVLPEDKYSKSGYELELMEAEAAKDSEDETEDYVNHDGELNFRTSPLGLQNNFPGTNRSPVLGRKISTPKQTEGLSTSDHVINVATGKEEHRSGNALNSHHIAQIDQQPSKPQDKEGIRDAKSIGLHAENITASSPKKDLLSSCSASKKSSDSNGSKYGSLYYTRKSPKESVPPLHHVDVGSTHTEKHLNRETPSNEHNMEESSVCLKTPLGVTSLNDKRSNDLLSYKRKMDDHSDISRGTSKSPKLGSSARKLMVDADIGTPINASKGPGKSASIGQFSNHSIENAVSKSVLEVSTGKKLQGSNIGVSTIPTSVMLVNSRSNKGQAQGSNGKLGSNGPFLPQASSTSKTENETPQNKVLIPETSLTSNAEKNTLQDEALLPENSLMSHGEKETPQNKVLSPENGLMSTAEKETPQNKVLFPENNLLSNAEKETPKNQQSVESNVLKATKSRNSKLDLALEADKSSSRSPRKKSVARKTLGSRPRSKMGSSAKQKGPICPSGTSPRVDTSVDKDNEIPADPVKASDANGPEMSAGDAGRSNDQQNGNILLVENNINGFAKSMDDDTEAPPEVEMVENNNVECREGVPSHHANITDEAQQAADTVAKNTSETATSEEITEQGGSVSGADKKKKLNKRKKMVGTKTKKPDPSVLEPKQVVNAEKEGRQSTVKNKKGVLKSSANSRGGVSSKKKARPSVEVEKENQPVDTDQNMAKSGKSIGKSITKTAKMMKNTDLKEAVNVVQNKNTVNADKQPAWFILSGHKLQRKEFQKIIRRLRGRLCRDSHNWSYQATHFIVPEPVRRTEKFFAAAASGSWILKTDYLSASDQAGKLLPEEPYEWHKPGLSEDGAINMEAPRKWRLLRERTGHGAFYGMRVVVYGECIAPPLDTLKRVVKAGDGTILATSPPYTRFLNAGVDYAIVSPGMPRVDIWIQEFLKHNIPCVSADYLVEYVCKPGFPLDKHVQYDTHVWAAKSFSNLVSRSEQVASDENENENKSEPSTPEENDLSCEVCGSAERGDVMLICGAEDGSSGCGFGTHIDCCDPPLKKIPKEDWFCPACAGKRASDETTGIKKKKTSKSRKR